MELEMTADIERHQPVQATSENERRIFHYCQIIWSNVLKPAVFDSTLSSFQNALPNMRHTEQTPLSNFDKAGKCLFLCLRDDYGCYAVQVPCIRPTEPNRFDRLVIKSFGKEEQSQKKHSLDKAAFESDAAIWRRMIKICFDNKGQWKKWLPFYGPIDVEEVNFQFAGVKDHKERYRITDPKSVDIKSLRRDLDEIIASGPDKYDSYYCNECAGETHSSKCPAFDDPVSTCIMEQIEAAGQRKKKLEMLRQLLDCARSPNLASDLGTLEGMAQDTCLYDIRGAFRLDIPQHNKPYVKYDVIRGIKITMGWQRDRITLKVPLYMSCGWFSLAFVWFCVVVWAGRTSDVVTAIAFGQLVAASISLVLVLAKD